MNEWIIPQPIDEIEITASDKYLWICGGRRIADDQAWKSRSDSNIARILPILIPQMLELDLASAEGEDIRLSYEQLANLSEHDISLFADLIEPSEFPIRLRLLGSLGLPSCRMTVTFHANGEKISPEIRGCLLKHDSRIFLLNKATFDLVSTVNKFNDLSPEHKKSPDAFRIFGEIKRKAEDCGAATDGFTENRVIVEPSDIGIQLIEEEEERISFAPKIEGVKDEDLERAFKRAGSATGMYDVEADDGKRATVLLNDDQREAVQRMTAVRHIKGSEKAMVLSDPQALFDGVSGAVNFEGFGPRVRGIGDFPFASQPFIQRSVTGIFDDVAANEIAGRFNAGIKFRYANGSEEDITFGSLKALSNFVTEVEKASKTGQGFVSYEGKTVALDPSFVDGIRELANKTLPQSTGKRQAGTRSSGKYLLIYTNEDIVEFADRPDQESRPSPLELPNSLLASVVLKEHQKKGVAWLQHNFRLNRSGCLLADDMGLGKTLQLLIFLAWLIEHNHLISETDNSDLPPWKPILIIAPVILVENETWIQDMRTFFEGDGAVFMPWLILRGRTLQQFRTTRGRETQLGEATLDLDRLREHRVVITNYETVINYQHSFAKMKDHWSVVVTDEAQEYKTPNTKVSHALKSLSPSFRVACTGTPVETKLFDVWNIFDFLQPGRLLGSAKDFRDRYERPLEAENEIKGAIDKLKDKLQFGQSDAYLLRRDKNELSDLPKKHEHRLECTLMASQREYHLSLLRRAGMGGDGNHPFKLVNEFLRVYQHPSLVPDFAPPEPEDALQNCHKLQVLIESLRSIKAKREKALIFARTIDMQQILAAVLKHRFGLRANIVNGSTKQKRDSPENSEGSQTRRAIIDRFRESDGFNVLILSPDVAGMGLTLTEANHVFHYGRWWNPAKEAQATDRVFRIGQEKDVHVYYLISKDPSGEIETFDEKLDRLLSRRLALASDFLAPLPTEDDLSKEFMDDLLSPNKI